MPHAHALRLKLLLVDDHALFREGMVLLLQRLAPGLLTREAASLAQALQVLDDQGAMDLVLLDLAMPGVAGLAGLKRLREAWPQTPVVVMSSDDAPATVLAALDAGAMGFIPKSTTGHGMVDALRTVLGQRVYIPPMPLSVEPGCDLPPLAAGHIASGTSARALGITPRQADVLRLILQGKSGKLIGRELGMSEGTVKTHTSAVLRALNVTTRTQAVIAASRLALHLN